MVCYLTQNMKQNGLFDTKHGNKMVYLTQNMETKWFVI